MARRRLYPPWIPGFWPLLAFLALLFAVIGCFYVLGRSTHFERQPEKAEPSANAAARK